MPEEEIWYLINATSTACSTLSSLTLPHQDIKPKTIHLTKDGRIKLYNAHLLTHGQSGYTKMLLDRNYKTTLSPALLTSLKHKKVHPSHSVDDSEVWSIGMTALCAAMNEDYNKYYDWPNYRIRYDLIKKDFARMKGIGFSNQLIELLDRMIEETEARRIKLPELLKHVEMVEETRTLKSGLSVNSSYHGSQIGTEEESRATLVAGGGGGSVNPLMGGFGENRQETTDFEGLAGDDRVREMNRQHEERYDNNGGDPGVLQPPAHLGQPGLQHQNTYPQVQPHHGYLGPGQDLSPIHPPAQSYVPYEVYQDPQPGEYAPNYENPANVQYYEGEGQYQYNPQNEPYIEQGGYQQDPYQAPVQPPPPVQPQNHLDIPEKAEVDLPSPIYKNNLNSERSGTQDPNGFITPPTLTFVPGDDPYGRQKSKNGKNPKTQVSKGFQTCEEQGTQTSPKRDPSPIAFIEMNRQQTPPQSPGFYLQPQPTPPQPPYNQSVYAPSVIQYPAPVNRRLDLGPQYYQQGGYQVIGHSPPKSRPGVNYGPGRVSYAPEALSRKRMYQQDPTTVETQQFRLPGGGFVKRNVYTSVGRTIVEERY